MHQISDKKCYIHFWCKMTPAWQVAQWYSWTRCKQSNNWRVRVEGGEPLLLRSEISLFWRTSCARDFPVCATPFSNWGPKPLLYMMEIQNGPIGAKIVSIVCANQCWQFFLCYSPSLSELRNLSYLNWKFYFLFHLWSHFQEVSNFVCPMYISWVLYVIMWHKLWWTNLFLLPSNTEYSLIMTERS